VRTLRLFVRGKRRIPGERLDQVQTIRTFRS
jgi:hypothetical protein